MSDRFTAVILCEGPDCNAGKSAHAREALPPRLGAAEADHRANLARSQTSRELALTPHTRVGVGMRGNIVFACDVCGHQRIYGNRA